MKILIGTLYSGENEYEECLAAINSQTYQNYEHIIIKDLPEGEAHRKLFTSFLSQSKEYELLIKIDADTVIISKELFKKVVEKFKTNEWLDVMNIAVSDFFSGELIPAGIQIYRNTVRWNFEKETLFTDIPETTRDKYYYDKTELAPAAIHCKNPSQLQAFHYGVHRGLKSIAEIHSTTHWALLRKTWVNFKKTGDVRIGLATLGSELVYAGKLKKVDADYTNPRMRAALSQYLSMNANQIEREIRKLKIFHWGILPVDYRRRIIRNLRGKYK